MDPVESSWAVLKELLLKGSGTDPPDETERNLIIDLARCDEERARSILRGHKYDDKLLVRVDYLIRNYDSNFISIEEGGIPIIDAVGDNGKPIFSPEAMYELGHTIHNNAREYYHDMVEPQRYNTDLRVLEITSQRDGHLSARWNDRCRELALQNPDAHDPSKKHIMERLERRISELDKKTKSRAAVDARATLAREGVTRDTENYEQHVKAEVHRQNRLKVLKEYYRDRAASDVINHARKEKHHKDDCENPRGCDCPTIMESKRTQHLNTDQRMGDRSEATHHEDQILIDHTRASMLDLGHILYDYQRLTPRDEHPVEKREKRIINWWKKLPSDERRMILGSRIKLPSTEQSLLMVLMGNRGVGRDERRSIFREISEFEGKKALPRNRGRDSLNEKHDSSIIGDWGSDALYEYLTAEITELMEDGEWADPRVIEDSDRVGPRKEGSRGEVPFPTYDYTPHASAEDSQKWEDSLAEQVRESTGPDSILSPGNALYLSQGDMDKMIRHQELVGTILLPTLYIQQEIDRERRNLAEMQDSRSSLFDDRARRAEVSPQLLRYAIRTLSHLRDSDDGKLFSELYQALHDHNGMRKDDVEHILDSAAGRKARGALISAGKGAVDKDGKLISGIDANQQDCSRCKGTGEVRRRRGRGTDSCPNCKGRGVALAIKQGELTRSQKDEIIENMNAEFFRLSAIHTRHIEDAARDSGFTQSCEECAGTGRDRYNPKEVCEKCSGHGETIHIKPFLDKIHSSNILGLDSQEALDAMIKTAERLHSVIRYRERARRLEYDIANLAKHGTLPDGTNVLLHDNRLHVKDGILSSDHLLSLRQRVLRGKPSMSFHRLRKEIGKELYRLFERVAENANEEHRGFRLTDSFSSPFMGELLDILAGHAEWSPDSLVLRHRLSEHLQKVNSPSRFDFLPRKEVCHACRGKGERVDYVNGKYIPDTVCVVCEGSGYDRKKDTSPTRIPRVFDSPLIRDSNPSCPCCDNGMSMRVLSPGGLGERMSVYHYPMDVDSSTIVVLDRLVELQAELDFKQKEYVHKGEDRPSLLKQIHDLNTAIEDLILGESEELNKALRADFQERVGEGLGRDMAVFAGEGSTGDDIAYGYNHLTESSGLNNTPCPFCAESVKMGEESISGSKDVPMLGDEDGYHAPTSFFGEVLGCPNDPHRESGDEILTQMLQMSYMPEELRDSLSTSWARGPVISDLRERYPSLDQITREEKDRWVESGGSLADLHQRKAQTARRKHSFSPIHPQTVGDLQFGRFAALRRRGGKPTPSEKFDNKYYSRYIMEGGNRKSIPAHLQEKSREATSEGHRYLEELEDSGVLEQKNHEKIKTLYAIHILNPDRLVHIHENPLQFPGEGEEDLEKWARGVLGLGKDEFPDAAHLSELKYGMHLLKPLLRLEHSWTHHYHGVREGRGLEHWNDSIFNTSGKGDFIDMGHLNTVMGELKGNLDDWTELFEHGYISPDHHGFQPTTNHFPEMILFLNNPRCPPSLAKAWINHDPALEDEGSDFYQDYDGIWATKGRTMEEMIPLAGLIWRAHGHFGEDYPENEEELEEKEYLTMSSRLLWHRIRNMLMRRSADPKGSRLALNAVLPRRDRGQLNQWGYGTSCNACDGIGHVSINDFLALIPSFKNFQNEEGELSHLPLDRDGNPLPRDKYGQIILSDTKTLDFLRDHGRTFNHPEWENHPSFDEENPTWLVTSSVNMQCPACEGTHVCPACSGHTSYHPSEKDKARIHAARQYLHGVQMRLHGKVIVPPTDPLGPVTLQIDPSQAMLRLLPDDIIEDYVPLKVESPRLDDMPPGKIWVPELGENGEETGYVLSMNDPWYSHTGGAGKGSIFDRELKRERWPAIPDEEAHERTIRELAGVDEKDESSESFSFRLSQCQFPGCKQSVWPNQQYCGPQEILPRVPKAFRGETGEGRTPPPWAMSEKREAPNHTALMQSDRMQYAMGQGIPSKNYWGGHENIQKMIDLGFNYVGSKRFGQKGHVDPEEYQELVKKGYLGVIQSVRASWFGTISALKTALNRGEIDKEQYEEELSDIKERKMEEMKDAVAAWHATIEKLDMHVPYFTHPDSGEVIYSPFDVFNVSSGPEDMAFFEYLPHGLDMNNPQHNNRVKFGDKTYSLLGVTPIATCPRCHAKLQKEDVESGECPKCELTFQDANRDYFYPGAGYGTSNSSLQWIPKALDARDKLQRRAEYIAQHMDIFAGEMDPALDICDRCRGTGKVRDYANNMVDCDNCINLPDIGHVSFKNWEHGPLVQYHRPNYQIMVGNAGDIHSFMPIAESDFEEALRTLRLGAGGSALSHRLLASELESSILEATAGPLEHLDEELDEKAAEKAEHYLRSLLDENTLIPTLNPAFMSNNRWQHPKYPKAVFRGYHKTRKEVERLNNQWLGQGASLLLKELLRVMDVKSLDDLGKQGPQTRDGKPTWSSSALLKSKVRNAEAVVRRLGDKPNLTKRQENELMDARLVINFTEFTEMGEPIAMISEKGLTDRVFMLLPREDRGPDLIRDSRASIVDGAFLSSGGRSSKQKAETILRNNLGTDNSTLSISQGRFGTAGSIYAGAMENIDNRAEGAFRVGAEEERDPETGQKKWRTDGKVMRDAIFTPAALHAEAVKAHQEGRVGHAEDYLTHIENMLGDTGIQAPSMESVSQQPQTGENVEEGSWDVQQSEEPIDFAWDILLKNMRTV